MGKQSTSTSRTELPAWANEGGEFLVGQAKNLANTPFEPYSGSRVADLTSDQTDAFSRIRDMIANAPNVQPTANALVTQGAGAPAQTVTPVANIMDPNSALGSVSGYLNPYIEGEIAPALRKIQEAAAAQGKKIGAQATAADAFGDARHGILEAALNRDTNLAVGETSGKMLSDAFNQAIAQRQADAARLLQAGTTNANLAEAAANRNIAGGGALVSTNNAANTGTLDNLKAYLASGTAQQSQAQASLDAAYQEFLRKYSDPFNKLAAMGGALQSAPKETTTTTSVPNNSLAGAAGGVAGALIGLI
jgi:hypothetical protein